MMVCDYWLSIVDEGVVCCRGWLTPAPHSLLLSVVWALSVVRECRVSDGVPSAWVRVSVTASVSAIHTMDWRVALVVVATLAARTALSAWQDIVRPKMFVQIGKCVYHLNIILEIRLGGKKSFNRPYFCSNIPPEFDIFKSYWIFHLSFYALFKT